MHASKVVNVPPTNNEIVWMAETCVTIWMQNIVQSANRDIEELRMKIDEILEERQKELLCSNVILVDKNVTDEEIGSDPIIKHYKQKRGSTIIV